jgi:hypothetical protein
MHDYEKETKQSEESKKHDEDFKSTDQTTFGF